jgi:hypothetical protein
MDAKVKNLQNFSGIKIDPTTGEEYVVHKPSGVIYLLRKPVGDLSAIRAQSDPTRERKPARKVYPKLARATFIEGSEPNATPNRK